MSSILAINCSPRETGSSSAIVDAVTDGAMGLSTNIIELYRIAKLRNINGCKACNGCKTAGKCIQKDDISEILDRIVESDCVIISTPVYFGGPSAQYKILEDRLYSFFDADMRSSLPAGKKAIIVVSCSGDIKQAEKVAKDIGNTLEALGMDIESTIAYTDRGGSVSAADDGEIMSLAKGVGLRFRNT